MGSEAYLVDTSLALLSPGSNFQRVKGWNGLEWALTLTTPYLQVPVDNATVVHIFKRREELPPKLPCHGFCHDSVITQV